MRQGNGVLSHALLVTRNKKYKMLRYQPPIQNWNSNSLNLAQWLYMAPDD